MHTFDASSTSKWGDVLLCSLSIPISLRSGQKYYFMSHLITNFVSNLLEEKSFISMFKFDSLRR